SIVRPLRSTRVERNRIRRIHKYDWISHSATVPSGTCISRRKSTRHLSKATARQSHYDRPLWTLILQMSALGALWQRATLRSVGFWNRAVIVTARSRTIGMRYRFVSRCHQATLAMLSCLQILQILMLISAFCTADYLTIKESQRW